MKTKLCITYLSTGKYKHFFFDFIRTFDLNFCSDCDRTFFVFTDDTETLKKYISKLKLNSSIEYFQIKNCSFNPDFNKFRKFKILNEAETCYPNFDYIFYFNGNLICRVPVTLNDLFQGREQYAVHHSLFDINRKPMYDSLCRFSKSAAFFDASLFPNYRYYQSGNIGATYDRWQKIIDFIESCRYYDKYHDLQKYIPWHDETYYNKCINVMVKNEPNKINILDGKMYLCTHLPELSEYAKKCKMLLVWKEYFWNTGKTISDLKPQRGN